MLCRRETSDLRFNPSVEYPARCSASAAPCLMRVRLFEAEASSSANVPAEKKLKFVLLFLSSAMIDLPTDSAATDRAEFDLQTKRTFILSIAINS